MLLEMLMNSSFGINVLITWIALVILLSHGIQCQDDNEVDLKVTPTPPPPPKEIDECNGIFLSYTFLGREKEYPLVKNVSAQSWAFKASTTVMNTGTEELKSWQVYIGFRYNEMLVSTDGAVVVDGDSFPIKVGKNGTTITGYPQTDLKTAIDTAGDINQMQAKVTFLGTQFGLQTKETPMPRTIKLVNPGYKCLGGRRRETYMHVCCTKDKKFKDKKKTKFYRRRYGDLSFSYDILKAYDSNYHAQVTIENNHPLGRLDQWNLTWEWMRNEFIYSMQGAYTHKTDPAECIYGPQGVYYRDFDFSNVMSCQKKPTIADLPPEKENDEKIGKLPFCCRDGLLLPKSINETKSKAMFQMEVFKLPPDLNRTAFNPPQNWKIVGRLNPTYKCGPPVRVDATEFPDSNGLDATTSAIASWQVTCNMTRPKFKEAKCCVSYSAYYSRAAIPCNTCACGCNTEGDDDHCNPNAHPMLLPPDALLVPFANRTAKAIALAHIMNKKVPKKRPCPDHCGVSINWHVDSDYKHGWTARVTIFNWETDAFPNWFSALELNRSSFSGFQKMYSFNATKVPKVKNTIMMQGLPGLNYLVGEVNGTHSESDPPIPGKQQTVISFKKRGYTLDIPAGDGFPSKMYFNGAQCSLPKQLPKGSTAAQRSPAPAVVCVVLSFLLLTIGLN